MAGASKVLVVGGTGKTGRAVVRGLRERGVPLRIGARNARVEAGVRFDWMDESTYVSAIDGVDGIYLVAPVGVLDPVPVMSRFIDRALEAGVRRFVLLSSSAIPIGGPAMGQVHKVLSERVPEWAVLQPSWFMQNFTEAHHGDTIRRESKIYSATGSAAVAFIDANDIGATGVACLCAERALNDGVVLTGPQALSYDQVAEIVSTAAGRRIEHVKLDQAQLARRFADLGLPADYADFLAGLDAFLAEGSEARTTDNVLQLTARAPASFRDFAAQSAEQWRGE